jgi:hypothetical protein
MSANASGGFVQDKDLRSLLGTPEKAPTIWADIACDVLAGVWRLK